MQIIITHGTLAGPRVFQLSRLQLVLAAAAGAVALLLSTAVVYHLLFVMAARAGWPLASGLLRLGVQDESIQRDRVLRENLDAMAQRVGEMQAKVVRLEAIGERVSGLAGVKPADLSRLETRPAAAPAAAASTASSARGVAMRPAQGGPYVPAHVPSMAQLDTLIDTLDERVDLGADIFTIVESRLFEKRLGALMIPTSRPVDGPVGSGFGFRTDPFSGRPALHTGLDFQADVGSPIMAAAGGVVVSAEVHPQYGLQVEIDHGNGLVTRYAHASKLLVQRGDIVRRGQLIAQVGTTGRSTGPHLHFEVMVDGVLQNPARFLAADKLAPASLALRGGPGSR